MARREGQAAVGDGTQSLFLDRRLGCRDGESDRRCLRRISASQIRSVMSAADRHRVGSYLNLCVLALAGADAMAMAAAAAAAV